MPDVRISKLNGIVDTHDGAGGARSEIDRLRAEVTRSRNRLGSSLAELERRVSVSASWRHWVRAYPLATLAIGLCAGYLVGRWGNGARRAA